MGIADYVLIILVSAAVIAAVAYMFRQRKSGKCIGCGGCCSSCQTQRK